MNDLSVEKLSEIVKKIMQYFLRFYGQLCTKDKKWKKKIIQLQILLENRDLTYKLQIVYCAAINFSISELFYDAFEAEIEQYSSSEITLATVLLKDKSKQDTEQIENVTCFNNTIIFANKKKRKITNRTYWDEYIGILFKNKIKESDIGIFEEFVKKFIHEQKPNYPRLRFVFMKDGHQVMRDSLDVDVSCCHAIAQSMACIVENSRNEDFKKKCLDMWLVSNSSEMNEKIYGELMHHLEEKL